MHASSLGCYDHEMESLNILQRALGLVVAEPMQPALEALQQASLTAEGDDRRHAMLLFQEAASRTEPGSGIRFQQSILEHAIRSAQRESHGQGQRGHAISVTIKKGHMDENITSNDTIASRGKRYMVGESFKTVVTMGLKLTDPKRNPACAFQFSRKTGKAGTMDLPSGTEVRYVGTKVVYEKQPSSKRMMFRVTKGSSVTLDGMVVALDDDIDIAGVINHIDPSDPYNVAAVASEVKRLEKSTLKAQATAVKADQRDD